MLSAKYIMANNFKVENADNARNLALAASTVGLNLQSSKALKYNFPE